MILREATADDAAAAAELRGLVHPELLTTPASYARRMQTSPPAARRRWWAAESGGALVGWATAGLVVETHEPGVVHVDLDVHPQHRRSGIGARLLDAVESHSAAVGGRRVFAWSRGDAGTAAFAATHGYERTSSSAMQVVDPRGTEPPVPPEGVEVLPFHAFADDPSPLYRLDAAAMLDEPNDVSLDAVEYESWLERWWREPLVDMEASMAAVVDDRPVSLTWLQTDRARGRGANNGTGTLREYRGRGLALLVKRASLAAAAAAGITAVYTGNDATNAPMLAINRRLGYRPCSAMATWGKSLTSAPSG